MAAKTVLLVGESWATSATHAKGFDQFGSITFHLQQLAIAGIVIADRSLLSGA